MGTIDPRVRAKTDQIWSSRYAAFETSVYESGGAYPPTLSEVISKIETCSVIDIVRPQLFHTMLDIGAGGGRWTLELANRVASVTALEPSNLFELLKNFTVPSCIFLNFKLLNITF